CRATEWPRSGQGYRPGSYRQTHGEAVGKGRMSFWPGSARPERSEVLHGWRMGQLKPQQWAQSARRKVPSGDRSSSPARWICHQLYGRAQPGQVSG
ncbi:MAG: hypothetical protein KA024_00665, partial [Zoogloea sp.]|nr:hypothetical protein [Zoogloea sp.]